MATFRDTIPSFLGGITQQTPALRGNNLVDDSVNMEYLPTEGATKRYPSIFEGELLDPNGSSVNLDGARFVSIERDDENYILAMGSDEFNVGFLYAWDANGNAIVVEDTNGNPSNLMSYLDFTEYSDIKLQQVADALFVANRRVVVDGAPGKSYPQWYIDNPGGGIAVLQGSYEVDYNLRVRTEGMGAAKAFSYRAPNFQDRTSTSGDTATIPVPAASTGSISDSDPATRGWWFLHGATINGSGDMLDIYPVSGAWSSQVFPRTPNDIKVYYGPTLAVGDPPGTSGSAAVEIPIDDFAIDCFSGAIKYLGTDSNVLSAAFWYVKQQGAYSTTYGASPSEIIRRFYGLLTDWFDGSSIDRPQVTLEGSRFGDLSDKSDLLWDPENLPTGNSLRIFFEDTVGDDDPITAFTFQDSEGGNFTSSWRDEVETLTDLPIFWKNGAVVKLTGGTLDKSDDEYIEFITDDDEDFDRGVWRESALPGLDSGGYNSNTMPLVVQRMEDGSGGYKFRWSYGEWDQRSVGDETSSPVPSFVGERIMDIFWHENRLGFLAGPNLILSESGQAYNFWRTTLNAVTDSDVIDVTLANMEGDTLFHAMSYDSRLMVFSDSSQSAVTSQGPLSARSIEAPVLSNFRCSPSLRPVAQGRSLFFGFGTGEYSQIRQLVPGQYQSDYQDAQITIGVPQLLNRNTRKIVSSNTSDALLFLSDDTSEVFVYQYLQSSAETLMSAWGRWSFTGSDILDVVALGDKLFFVMGRDGKSYLESVLFGSGRGDVVNNFEARLDRRSSALTGVYDYNTAETTFTLPFDFAEEDNVVLAASDNSYLKFGTLVTPTDKDPVAKTVSIAGDFSQQPMFAGIPFESKLVMSRPLVKMPSQKGGLHATVGGRQICRDLVIYLADTGYAKATVEIVGSPTTTEEFLGDVAGVGSITPATTRSDEFRIPIHADVNEFRVTVGSDTALPFSAVTGAWTTRYTNKKPSR